MRSLFVVALLFACAASALADTCSAPTCSAGSYQTRPGFQPSSNGCGSYGFSIEAPFGVTPCCDRHDFCYQSCNSTKETCDTNFDQCMKGVCATQSSLERAACRVEAEAFYQAVVNFGCRAYENNQEEACECANSDGSATNATRASPAASPSPAASAAAAASPSAAPAGLCSAAVTVRRDGSTWVDGQNRTTAVYRLDVANTGAAPLTNVVVSIGLGGAGAVVSSFNLEPALGGYAVTNFGNALAPNQSFAGAGLTIAGAASVTANVYGSACAAPTMPSPPASPAPLPSGTPQRCAATVVVAQDGVGWVDSAGRTNAVYRLVVTNTGRTPLTDYVTSFALNGGTIAQVWNLASTRGGYALTNFGNVLAPGQSFDGAGFIAVGATNVVATPYGSACQ